jgi:hypothetical protein
MRPPRSGVSPADTGPTPVTHQGTSVQRSPRRLYDTTPTALSPAPRTNTRRWTRKPSAAALAWDVVVFAIWFAMVAAIILAMCAMLWVAS